MEKDYRSFLRQLLNACNAERAYSISGSAAELPFCYTMSDFTDLDLMTFPRDRCAVSTEDFRPENFNGTVYIIESIPDYPGYAKLRTGREYLKREDFLKRRFSTQGPSYEDEIAISNRRMNDKMKISKVRSVPMLVDYVQCIVSSQWPLQAKDWATRKRTNGWPSEDMIARVVNDGCHLVRKSHPNCSDDNETFRLSFSKAEIILIRTWNSNQIHIYHLIRQVKRRLEMKWKSENHNSAICTYFFKTLMLWAYEGKCNEFWNDCNIRSSLHELLITTIEWLIEIRCPNYFIPECNILGHLQAPDFDFEKEIIDILEVSNNLGFPIKKPPDLYQTISISFPNKSLVYMQLTYSHSIGYLKTSNREWLRSSSSSGSCTYSPLVREEFRDLYIGILHHYRLVTEFQNDLYLSKTSRYLNRAVEDDHRCSIMELNVSNTILDLLESIHVASDPHATIPEAVISYLEDAVFTPKSAPHKKFNLFDVLRPSFGVSASYLANFHYSTRRDYDQANRICEEASTMLTNDSVTNSDPYPDERYPYALLINNKLIVLFDHQNSDCFRVYSIFKWIFSNVRSIVTEVQ